MHKKYKIIAGLCATAVVLVTALDVRLRLVEYTIESDKITQPVRLALVTDLHGCDYGEGQRTLLDMVEAQQPDVVLFGGDMFDEDLPVDGTLVVMQALAAQYPCYYVTGNHEYKFTLADNGATVYDLLDMVRDCGVTVLEGESDTLTVHAQTLQVCGISDPLGVGESAWQVQLDAAAQDLSDDAFSVLLTHRPERVDDYLVQGFDLSVAGHAHGGQWRIPWVLNGLLAPNQGFFPEYAGGYYDFNGQSLVVSRGLARESTWIPRIYNPPELVMITLT